MLELTVLKEKDLSVKFVNKVSKYEREDIIQRHVRKTSNRSDAKIGGYIGF